MHRTVTVVVFLVVSLGLPRRARADRYDDSLAREALAERRGDLAGAARELEETVPMYAQDYAIALTLGSVYFRAGRYEDAERAYRLAEDRAPASDDARLGVAWSLVREGKCDDAIASLRSVLSPPAEPSAEAARAACTSAPPALSLSAAWNEYLFPSHPWKASGTGVTASAESTIASRWVLGGAYRYVHFATSNAAGVTVAPFAQNEGYVDAGYASEGFALVLRGAIVADGTGALGTSPHAGVSTRWSPEGAGDGLLDASVSKYPDLAVARVAPRWRVPLGGPFSVIPGVYGQLAGSSVYGGASLAALASWERTSLWIGGKYGQEVRPAYLDAHVVYDLPDHVVYGAWAGVRARVTDSVGLTASYAFDWLRRTDALTPKESAVHSIVFGPFVDL
jgi:hypothetical protein